MCSGMLRYVVWYFNINWPMSQACFLLPSSGLILMMAVFLDVAPCSLRNWPLFWWCSQPLLSGLAQVMNVLCDIALFGVVEIDRRFRASFCRHNYIPFEQKSCHASGSRLLFHILIVVLTVSARKSKLRAYGGTENAVRFCAVVLCLLWQECFLCLCSLTRCTGCSVCSM